MNKTILLLCSLALSFNCLAADIQTSLDVTSIPDSLKKEAHAVVRNATTIFEYKSATSAIEKLVYAITILDKKGESLAAFNYPGDQFRSLSSFSGKMYDASGNLLKKYKMSDIRTSEWSSSLASDALHYYFECAPPTFPFTIVYEYEINWKNGILSFPAFVPQDSYNLSVEKASFELLLPENMAFKSKVINMQEAPSKSTIKGITTYNWNVKNLTAIEDEVLDYSLNKYLPFVFSSPQNFVYDKVPGAISDWKSYGKWVYDLTLNRDILTEETKSKLIEMTKNAATDREKVKILYDYLGETTHYVSIQLGIGGLQPMLASEVCKTNFGDCKALSNYMKAMLSAVGIYSNYCFIRFDEYEKKLFSDYANFYQTNHAILQVPLPNDTLWLECTNPKTPFGFAHNGISGHDVLVCNADGGKMLNIPDYPDSLNIEQNKAIVEIGLDGSAKVKMNKQYHTKIYDDNSWFSLAKSSEQIDDLRKDINLPNVTMGSIQFKEDKSPFPTLPIDYTWTTSQYGTKTGNRLFIPVNAFRGTFEGLKKSKRVHDIHITKGFKDVDSICIRIPEGYAIESIPATNNLSTTFGSMQSLITSTGKEILIKQNVFIPSGSYDVSKYPEFIGFFDKISAAYRGRIILKKL